MIDVKNKTCLECGKTAAFGLPGNSVNSCAKHKGKNYIIYPMKKCYESKCKEIGTHEYVKKRYCENHAPGGSMNFGLRPCVSCGLDSILDKDNKCEHCDPINFNKYIKAKEQEIKAFLDVRGYKYKSHDEMIDKGECNKYRPDFLFDCLNHFVVLEVDENQHSGVSYSCDDARTKNIIYSLGMKTIFIRYNPDRFKVKNETRKSDFTKHKRYTILKQYLDICLDQRYDFCNDYAREVKLFYDGFDETNVRFQKIDII